MYGFFLFELRVFFKVHALSLHFFIIVNFSELNKFLPSLLSHFNKVSPIYRFRFSTGCIGLKISR